MVMPDDDPPYPTWRWALAEIVVVLLCVALMGACTTPAPATPRLLVDEDERAGVVASCAAHGCYPVPAKTWEAIVHMLMRLGILKGS